MDFDSPSKGKKAMSVVIVMDRDLSDYTALPLTFAKSLRKLGTEVHTVFFNVPIRVFQLINKFIPFLNRWYLKSKQEEIIRKIEKSNCEYVLVVKGFFMLDTTIEALKRTGKKVVCYNPDDPFNPNFGSANDVIRAAISSYDAYFIWSLNLIDPIKEMGCENVYYLPFAADEDIIKPIAEEKKGLLKQDFDVSFIGGADEKRINLIKSVAKRLDPEINFVVYGNGWPQIPGVVVNPSIHGEAYLEVMYRSKINLNILRVQNEDSNNMRTFEIPASGCFMLHERSEEAVGLFKPGVEADFYIDAADCTDKINQYLNNDSDRFDIAEAGYKKIYSAGYLYEDLMQNMLTKISELTVLTD